MGAFTAYTFAAGIFLLAGYLVYKTLMASEKQASFNRAVILGLYAVSFLLPLLPVQLHIAADAPAGAVEPGMPEAVVAVGDRAAISAIVFRIITAVYLTGAAVVAVMTVITAVRLRWLLKSGESRDCGYYTVVRIPSETFAPFSYGRYIVVSGAENAGDAELIIRHECAHIRCRHFLDLLVAQAVCVVLWYNPASWLMLAELKAVHEYQADEAVLRSGANVRQYQMLLIKKAVGVRFQSLANSLNHSNLKKRITMMYKSNDKPLRRVRALAAVPALALAAVFMNIPAVSNAVGQLGSSQLLADGTVPVVKVTNYPEVVQPTAQSESQGVENPEVLPEYPGGLIALMGYLCKEMRYPEGCIDKNIEGKVVVGFTVGTDGAMSDFRIIKGVDPLLDAEALRVVRSITVRWKPGENGGKPVACAFALPIEFKLN